MRTRKLPPIAVAIRFIDCINRGDIDGLERLMTDDHRLVVFDEAPVEGREANARAWRGYVAAFPNYVIHPTRLSERGRVVAILGSTTGSHLDLPDTEELKQTLIWIAEVSGGLVETWTLVGDNAANREAWGLVEAL